MIIHKPNAEDMKDSRDIHTRQRADVREVEMFTQISPMKGTSKTPAFPPAPDQLPLMFDTETRTLYCFVENTWIPMKPFSMTQLSEVDLRNIKNLDQVIHIPVTYDTGNGVVEGTITLAELKKLL